jgi:hypothetical protein
MQSFSRVLVTAWIFALGLSACSGGGLTLPPAAQCSPLFANNVPDTLTPPPAVKVSTGPTDPEALHLQPGTYTYTNGTLYFKEGSQTLPSPKTAPIVIQLQNQATAGVVTQSVGVCMLNARMGATGITANTDSVTDIVVHSDLTQTVSTRHFAFSIMNPIGNTLTVTPTTLTTTAPTYTSVAAALQPVVPTDTPITASVLMQNSVNDFEMRTQMGPNFYLSVHMTYVSCVAPNCP